MPVPQRRVGRFGALLGAVALSLSSGGWAVAPVAADVLHPAVAEYHLVSTGTTPPDESACIAIGTRCFGPAAIRNAYDLPTLYEQGFDGRGITIAIVDAYGSDTIAHDLHVYDQAFGLQAMCGEEGVTCTAGMPTFSRFHLQGAPATVQQPGNGTGQENKAGWAVEVSLDVELAHAIAPMANILLVTTPTAETLGVQGFPQMMDAEQYVIDHGMAQVISQSFASAEDAFGSSASLLNLRHAYVSAAQHGVTVLGSSGDNGTANTKKSPVHQGGTLIPYPTVEWPASDPLVTGVGGTYLCLDPATGTTVDDSIPGGKCLRPYGLGQREVAWTFAGGGFSHVFSRPTYQDALPAGSTAIGGMRGVPDVALLASAGTGPLIYVSLPGTGSDLGIDGWNVIGGTSVSCPGWAGLIAIADQINGGGLGLINPGLYRIGADPTRYAADFHDIATGNTNQTDPSVPGYAAGTGWDPVTGLGTPDAAMLLPDLVNAVHGH
ncbi:MAG TPA: S53 family peptidase [Candidatus Dormibacteraeota bacterium]|nr:S53 family peptidase [Candidatus Dormibacteraeota bacterium]